MCTGSADVELAKRCSIHYNRKNKREPMPVAEIVTIGTELLLGEILDTNTRFLARELRNLGVDLYRTTTVGDNEERIAGVLKEALGRSQIVLTTGGLGPTVDDPTRQAVARALGVELEFHPELWQQIQERFQRYGRQPSENNRRQAFIPQGAIPIPNPVGTAPAFIGETSEACIISLPGVPREMEYLFQHAVVPYLKERFHLHGVIQVRVLHTAGVGESQIDEWIGDLETSSNPTVGLLAHPGQCDIRITAKAETPENAASMIADMEALVRQRCGEAIFGADADTLETVIAGQLSRLGWKLLVVEVGLEGELCARLRHPSLADVSTCRAETIAEEGSPLVPEKTDEAQVFLGVCLSRDFDSFSLRWEIVSPQGRQTGLRKFGGAPALVKTWAGNTALDLVRRHLSQKG